MAGSSGINAEYGGGYGRGPSNPTPPVSDEEGFSTRGGKTTTTGRRGRGGGGRGEQSRLDKEGIVGNAFDVLGGDQEHPATRPKIAPHGLAALAKAQGSNKPTPTPVQTPTPTPVQTPTPTPTNPPPPVLSPNGGVDVRGSQNPSTRAPGTEPPSSGAWKARINRDESSALSPPITPPPTALGPLLTNDETSARIKRFLVDYKNGQEMEECLDELQEINNPGKGLECIKMIVSSSYESKEKEIQLLRELFSYLLDKRAFDQAELLESFTYLMENLEEETYDAPRAPVFFSSFLALPLGKKMLKANHLDSILGATESNALSLKVLEATFGDVIISQGLEFAKELTAEGGDLKRFQNWCTLLEKKDSKVQPLFSAQ
eukprot:TRINITY_DN433_c0_g1_i1.p1 TRINITY_DN433_c0_g1~~TRINITY_DN433_c0_g1_i1.p1  ORF type:complete len:374 (+),score=120.46 TRINITY_DN433_c0_g1_i1:59-1180(+)